MSARTRRPLAGLLTSLSLLLLPASFGACGSDIEQVDLPEVRCVGDCRLTFASQDLTRRVERKIVIENIGEADLLVRDVRIVDSSPHMEFSSANAFLLVERSDFVWTSQGGQSFATNGATVAIPAGGGQLEFELSLQVARGQSLDCPNGDNANCGFLVIETNSRQPEDQTLRVPITINAGSGDIVVSPSVVNLPDPSLNQTFPGEFTVGNNGDAPLSITEVTVTGPGANDLTVINSSNLPLPVDIAAGGELDFDITWTPTTLEPLDAQVTIRSSGGNGIVVIRSGEGSGPVLTVDPCDIEFLEAVTGSPNDATFDVGNTGGSAMTFSINLSDVVPPSARNEFTIRTGDGSEGAVGPQPALEAGQTRTYRLVYTPSEERSVTGNLQFNGNFSGLSRRCPFRAGAAAPEIDVVPRQLYMGNLEMDESDSRAFIVANRGLSPLEVTSVTLTETGDTFEEFSLEEGVEDGFTLAPGSDRTLEVFYTRASADVDVADRATITIESNDPIDPRQTVLVEVNHGGAILPPTCDLQVTPDPEYTVGQTLTFDATGSTLADGSSWAPAGRFTWGLSTPDSSAAGLSAPTGDTVTISPDVPGSYSITLTATALFGERRVNCQTTRTVNVQP